MNEKTYRETMYGLFVELVKLQRHFIDCDDKILILLEGRDAAGKDGAIKRMAKHLSPRDACVVALGKPSDRDRRGWYFQCFVPHLPVAGELVLFNRSWYNRAGVERVKRLTRINFIRDVLGRLHYFDKDLKLAGPDPEVALTYDGSAKIFKRLAV